MRHCQNYSGTWPPLYNEATTSLDCRPDPNHINKCKTHVCCYEIV